MFPHTLFHTHARANAHTHACARAPRPAVLLLLTLCAITCPCVQGRGGEQAECQQGKKQEQRGRTDSQLSFASDASDTDKVFTGSAPSIGLHDDGLLRSHD